jgi:3-isopropylmalate/(R)-2-methylmalate dehydratase small subunit
MKHTGTVIKYGDNIDTDVIIPARYLNMQTMAELAAHCMEDIDPTFLKRVKKGDIIVGGSNFGCGSSREHAPIAIMGNGVAAVVAKSFARIFYRNSINSGLAIVECDADIDEGDLVEIDFDNGKLTNLTKNIVSTFAPFPPFLQNIIQSGGLLKTLGGECK